MNEEVIKRLDALAAQLGVGANYIWPLLVKRAITEAITGIAVCAILGIGSIKVARKLGKVEDSVSAAALSWVFLVCGWLVLVAGSSVQVDDLIAPEAKAFKWLCGMLLRGEP